MICKICNAEFETKAKLDNHRRIEHQSKCIVLGEEVNKTVNGFPCPECAKFLDSAKKVQEHAKKHSGRDSTVNNIVLPTCCPENRGSHGRLDAYLPQNT